MIHHGTIWNGTDKVANRVTVVYFVQLYYYKLIATCFFVSNLFHFFAILIGCPERSMHCAHDIMQTKKKRIQTCKLTQQPFFVFAFQTALVERNRSKFGRVCPAFRKVIQRIELHIVCSFKCDNNRKGEQNLIKTIPCDYWRSTGVCMPFLCIIFASILFLNTAHFGRFIHRVTKNRNKIIWFVLKNIYKNCVRSFIYFLS